MSAVTINPASVNEASNNGVSNNDVSNNSTMNSFSLLNGQIQGLRWGSGDKKVLAFHGFLDHSMSFSELAKHLPDIEIWAIDLPGHGLSKGLPKLDGMFLLNWLPILGHILDELAWDDFVVLGHSMGAITSQLLAVVDDRISHVLSLDALGPYTSEVEGNLDRYRKLYRNRGKLMPVRYYSSYESLCKSRESGLFPLSSKAAKVMAKRAVGYNDKGWFHRYDRRLRHESLWRLSEQDVLSWLSNIDCKVDLLIFNADSWDGYQDVLEGRIKAVKNLHISKIEGSHHLHLENPLAVSQWVRQRLL